MIQLIVDYATDKIVGYNTIVPENPEKDIILTEDSELGRLVNLNLYDNLYYIDGKITEKEEPDAHYIQLKAINEEYEKAHKKVDGEHKIFMDNILSGMTVEEASEISRQNREQAENLEREKTAFHEKEKELAQTNIFSRFKEEEKDISYQYFLSMVTVVRDENDYLEEWIRYHIEELGFEHFYLYDNESSIPAKRYLEDAGFKHLDKITFLDWETSENTQHDIHVHFLEHFGKETKWYFAADPDEYVLIKDKSKTLREFLEENDRYAAIECIWRHFNANGLEKKTDGTDMERFTTEVDWHYGKGHGKFFAHSNRTKDFANYRPYIRFEAAVLSGEKSKADDFFQLNHYYTRSYEEWLKKIKRGTVVPHAKRKYSEFFELNPDMKYLDAGTEVLQTYGSNESKME